MNKTDNQAIERVAKAIGAGSRFAVMTHVRPDGDALGAVLAMTGMLRRLGKTAQAYCNDGPPPGFEFLAGVDMLRQTPPAPGECDAAIAVDCGDAHRVGETLEPTLERMPVVINIDHHIAEKPFGDPAWVDAAKSSSCELLYELSKVLGVKIDAELATMLYTGIMTDTGSFRFSNTRQRTLEIAAELVAAGADPAGIAQHVYESASPQRLLLQARFLASLNFHAGHRLAEAALTQDMIRETGGAIHDTEGFVNDLRSVAPVQVAMFFKEDSTGVIHVSMRAKSGVDVAEFARRHGGGGHRAAAAFRVPGPMETVRKQLVEEAIEYLGNGKGR